MSVGQRNQTKYFNAATKSFNTSRPSVKIIFVSLFGVWAVFTKGLRLSQVLGLNVVLKLRLLSQLSFVLKPYPQRVT